MFENVLDLLAGRESLEGLPVDHVVPGHGEICTLREVHELKEQFVEIRDMMRDLIRSGREREDAELRGTPRDEPLVGGEPTLELDRFLPGTGDGAGAHGFHPESSPAGPAGKSGDSGRSRVSP